MAFQKQEISSLVEVDPKKAAGQILAALKSTGMHKGDAARELGASHGTLIRWIKQLRLEDAIEKMAKAAAKEGWLHEKNRQSPGRPRGAKDKLPRRRREVANPG